MSSPAKRRPEEWLARRGGVVELLRLPAALFRFGAGARACLYDHGWIPAQRVDAPVVSVGNLTAGGTGKTPFVHMLVHEFLRRGQRPGIVSRGYGASGEGEDNDETRMAADLVRAGAEMIQSPRRAVGARKLIERGATVIIMDDGFQHRALARDLDFVLCDATRPWGLPEPPQGGDSVKALLPRGLLREPPSALARADALVVTRVDQVSEARLERLERELERHAPGVGVLHASHRATRLRSCGEGETVEPSALAGETVDLVSGIGNPEAFERTVTGLGAKIREHRSFPDHHPYVASDLEGLGGEGVRLVTTAKDAVKWESWKPAAWVLDVELVLIQGAELFAALLDSLSLSSASRRRQAIHAGLHG